MSEPSGPQWRPGRWHAGACFRLLGLIAFLNLAVGTHRLSAQAQIQAVGVEIGGAGTSFTVENWSNPALPKSYSIGGTNVYGTAGYYQIRPVSPWNAGSGVFVYDGVGGGNDLGVSASTNATLASVPSFIGSISGFAGTYVNFDGYAVFRGPDGSSLYRQGALSVPVNQGPYTTASGTNASFVGTPLQFTLGTAARFRVGLVVDTVADGAYAPDYVSVFNTNTATVFAPVLTRNGVPDMVFFDIDGAAGETFIVGVWQNTNTQLVAALALATFDLLPSSTPALSCVASNGSLIVSWPAETTGWTLESSTDLGSLDSWEPVPGVVSNSVVLPMTEPKNFFRLRQAP